MKFRVLFLFLFFFLLNILVRGMNQIQAPFYSTFAIAIPLENNTVIFSRLIFNYAIIMVFAFIMIHNIKQLFLMSPYILPRTSKAQMYWLFVRRTIKHTIWVVLIKLLADLLTGQLNGLENMGLFLTLYASFLLTLTIWLLLIFILYTLKTGERRTIFIVLGILFLSQYLSVNMISMNVLVVASPSILTNFKVWSVIKVFSVLLLLLISYGLFKNKEFIGDEKE